jgi:hypothetical protein
MDFDDTVRVRCPHSDLEHRLGTIIAITRPEHGALGGETVYHVQFPGGACRRYTAAALKPCIPEDDRAAITASLTAVFHTLRGTARRALDNDPALAADITDLLVATTHLLHYDLDIDPRALVPKKPARAGNRSTDANAGGGRPRWTHGRSERHSGPVCGTDEPGVLVTDDPDKVTCPDCPDAAENEAIPDDEVSGGPHVIGMLRAAKAGHSRKIDGVIIDPTTANAILTVFDAASPKTKAKITKLPITLMISLAWNVLRSDD